MTKTPAVSWVYFRWSTDTVVEPVGTSRFKPAQTQPQRRQNANTDPPIAAVNIALCTWSVETLLCPQQELDCATTRSTAKATNAFWTRQAAPPRWFRCEMSQHPPPPTRCTPFHLIPCLCGVARPLPRAQEAAYGRFGAHYELSRRKARAAQVRV